MSVVEAMDGKCHYYLTRKKRFCRFQPKGGQQYCPEHSCIMGIHNGRKRIPCPLNPKHNCYEDDLDKHVLKCNVTKTQQATQEAPYYIRGINKLTGISELGEMPVEGKKVKDLTSRDLAELIARVDKLYTDQVANIESVVLEHSCVKEEFCTPQAGNLGRALEDQAALRKELLQQASLIGQLEQLGLLCGSGHCFVEMGAGKGKLSHWIQKASKDVTDNWYLLVERSSVRYKMDSFHKQGGVESEFQRIKIDIEDLCLGSVDLVKSCKSVVVVGKHLCGGATDMGIRCAMETLGYQKTSQLLSPSSKSDTSDCQLPHLDSNQQQLDNHQAEKLGAVLSSKPSDVTAVSEAHVGVDTTSTVGTFEGNSPQLTECSSDHSSLHLSDSTSCEQLSAHVLGRNMQQEICEDNNEQSVMESKRKGDNSLGLSNEQEPPVKAQRLIETEPRHRLPAAIMIALCCHHRCTWDTYVGQGFMQSCGISPAEFDLLTRLSSWATCAKVTAKSTRNKASEKLSETLRSTTDESGIVGSEMTNRGDHGTDDLVTLDASKTLREQLSISEREEIGRKCKRLIDTGRLHYLRTKGMDCFLREYIDESLTPENVVLIARLPDS